MTTKLTQNEQEFWNNPAMANYFGTKPADPRVVDRLEKIADKLSKKALDLGCGGGRHTEWLMKTGFDTYAVDPNQEMIRTTLNRVTHLKPEADLSTGVVLGDICQVPFADNYFDVVVVTGVLHQAKSQVEYQKAVAELARVAKKGAVICLNIFTNTAWDESYSRVDGEDYTVVTKEGLWMTLLPKVTFYSLMQQAGLELEADLGEDIKQENTGVRSVLRANFIKII